ncbi:MAG TPA: ferrous iron transport protein B, partial [Bacteroidota bacterium]
MGKSLTHFNKHRHPELTFFNDRVEQTTVVLAGNPNVGKSLLFNRMSGVYVDVSNYPGTTVQITRGVFGQYNIFDTPGIYGVSSFNDEESVARDIILEADVILNVVDATHLERDIFLTQQLIDTGKKVTVLLNFMDEVKKHGITIDIPRLSHFLGVEIVPIIAVKNDNTEKLQRAIERAREGVQRQELHARLHAMLDRVGSQAEALLVLEGDEVIAKRHGVQPEATREEIYIERRNRVNYIVDHVLSDLQKTNRFSEVLGKLSLHPATGIPLLAVVLYVVYLIVGKLIAQDLVGFTEGELGQNLWGPWVRGVVHSFVPSSSWLSVLLVGEFGVITMTTTYLLFLLLPLVAAFYTALSILEDSGYLPRLATMVDRSLTGLGLNGRAVIPIILGFGCVTSATITTRLLGTEREKTIATTILQFAIPCSAQLAVIAALLAGAGFLPMLIYTLVIAGVFLLIGTVLNRVLPGSSTPLLLDLPPMRLPKAGNVMHKTAIRTWQFMKEASGWFFVGALAVGVAQLTGALRLATQALVPLTTHWLQLPEEAATAFIMGVVRRDFGAAGL